MVRKLVPLLLVLAVVSAPGPAAAQDNPFAPLPQAAQPTPTPVATPQPASDQQDVSRGLLLAIAGAVAVVFVGIGWFITRDARRSLTPDDRRALERGRTEDERRRGEVKRRQARAAGKRQRQARKMQRRR